MKKFLAILLAVVMVLALTVTAMAEDMTGEQGVIGEFTTPDNPTAQTDTVVIYKEITAYNPETVIVNAPTITYNYTIGAATVAAGTTVTDNETRHNQINSSPVTATVAVKAGVGTPTITNIALVPGTNTLNASQYGTANRFPITIDFTSVDWATAGTGAGVYRYEVNETTALATKNAAGIAEGTTPKQLFLDVYVDGSGNIYGYVLFTTNTTIDGSTSEATAASTAGKIEGFVDDPAGTVYSDTNASTADKYYTFNLDLTKVVVNDAYALSTHHQFPFTVTLDNPTVTAEVLPIMTVGSNATQTALTASAIGTSSTATVWRPSIAGGATINYVGIPCGTTITISETNDVIGVTYNSVSTNADTNAAAKSIDTNEVSNTATIDCNAAALTAAVENHTSAANKVVTFTNTLLQISPTGVTLRLAPYMLILAMGTMLLLFSRKTRKTED